MRGVFSKSPFLLVFTSLILGILLGDYINNLYINIAIFTLGVIAMFFVFKNRKNKGVVTFSAVFILFLFVGLFSVYQKKQQIDFPIYEDTHHYKGIITQLPQEKDKTISLKLYLENEHQFIMAYLKKDSLSKQLNVGEAIFFKSKLQQIENYPLSSFDYAKYMYYQGITTYCFIAPNEWILASNNTFSLEIYAQQVRAKLLAGLKAFGFSEQSYAFLSAILLGYQNNLTPEIKDSFQKTGTIHVLAVSGLHVGIIFLVISKLVQFIPILRKHKKIKYITIIILLLSYAFITGLSPSVLRASLMLIVYCVGKMFSREANPLNTLAIAGTIILIINPFYLFHIGFQLSFMSAFSLVYVYPMWQKRISCYIKNKVVAKIAQLLSISIIAQCATAPLVLYYFGTFPNYFFIANLIVVPLITIFIQLSILLPVFAVVMTVNQKLILSISKWIISAFDFFIQALLNFLNLLSNLPHAQIDGLYLNVFQVILLYLSFAILVRWKNFQSKYSYAFSICLLLFLATNIYDASKQPDVQMYHDTKRAKLIFKRDKQFIEYSYEGKDNPLVEIGGKRLLIYNTDPEKVPNQLKLAIDYLIILNSTQYSSHKFYDYFDANSCLFDSKLSKKYKKDLLIDCKSKGINCLEVNQKDVISLKF